MKETKISAKVPVSLVADLRRIAKAQDRSLSAEIRQALRDRVEALSKEAPVRRA
jgi:predicted transcriptional regulator